MTTEVCENCLGKIIDFFLFRELCAATDFYNRTLLAALVSTTKPVSEPEPVASGSVETNEPAVDEIANKV